MKVAKGVLQIGLTDRKIDFVGDLLQGCQIGLRQKWFELLNENYELASISC